MGHVLLNIDLNTELNTVKDSWHSLKVTPKGLYDDSDSDRDSDEEDENDDDDKEGNMGEIRISYKLIWSEKTIRIAADNLLKDIQGKHDDNEDLEEAPNFETTKMLSTLNSIAEEESWNTTTTEQPIAPSSKSMNWAAYDSTIAQWWYVASDQYQTVMGPYTGIQMAGWLGGGYFDGNLNVCCNGHVTKVEWALLSVLYPTLTRAFIVAPEGKPEPAIYIGRGNTSMNEEDESVGSESESSGSSSSGSSSEESSDETSDSEKSFGDDNENNETKESNNDINIADSSQRTHWVIVKQGEDPVAMSIDDMRNGLSNGILNDNTYACIFGNEKWVSIRNFC